MTESFETIDEPKAKSESEARSFCDTLNTWRMK